jgi:hypothetical protein
MSIALVTTFNKSGYELYGKRMLDSLHNLPDEIELIVYTEGFALDHSVALEEIEWLNLFKLRNTNRQHSSFHFDAVRFSHKVAAVTDAAKNYDYLIWADGDLFFHNFFPIEVLRDFFPTGTEYISWLWRDHTYPECGFYIINLKHPSNQSLMEEWVNLYETDRIYELQEWHDSFVLLWLVNKYLLGWRSLSGDYSWTSHPMINGPLGGYIDHLKGERKHNGESFVSDLVHVRSEDYWCKRYRRLDPLIIRVRYVWARIKSFLRMFLTGS